MTKKLRRFKVFGLLPYVIVAAGMMLFGWLAARGQPPVPGTARVMSPRAAGSADTFNKAMVVSSNVIIVTTNTGSVAATFAFTQLAVNLKAGFVYSVATTNGPWKVLGSTNYPPGGGQLQMNYAATNVPVLYFRAFYQWPYPTS